MTVKIWFSQIKSNSLKQHHTTFHSSRPSTQIKWIKVNLTLHVVLVTSVLCNFNKTFGKADLYSDMVKTHTELALSTIINRFIHEKETIMTLFSSINIDR